MRISAALLTGEYAWLFWGVVGALAIAFGALALPYLPAPADLRMPAFQPRYAQATAVASLAVVVILLVQAVPVTPQAGPVVTPAVVPWLPWVLLILLALFGVTILPLLRRNVIAGTVLSGVLVNLAAIAKRFLIVVPSQTHGPLLPYTAGSYSPTWVEYSIILGLFALGTLLYVLFVKVFPIMEVPE